MKQPYHQHLYAWTDAYITNVKQELEGMIKEWKYEYGVDDRECSVTLLWMVQKLNPTARIDPEMLEASGQMHDAEPSELEQWKTFDQQLRQLER